MRWQVGDRVQIVMRGTVKTVEPHHVEVDMDQGDGEGDEACLWFDPDILEPGTPTPKRSKA